MLHAAPPQSSSATTLIGGACWSIGQNEPIFAESYIDSCWAASLEQFITHGLLEEEDVVAVCVTREAQHNEEESYFIAAFWHSGQI